MESELAWVFHRQLILIYFSFTTAGPDILLAAFNPSSAKEPSASTQHLEVPMGLIKSGFGKSELLNPN